MLLQPNRVKRQLPKSLKRQEGVVIIVALFIVALVATMSYVMMARLDRDTLRTRLILRDAQAEFYAQGSIAWAMDQLRNDWIQHKKNQLIDAIPIQSPVKNQNGYEISSVIYDMQGRFNINNLSMDADAQASFKHLLQLLLPKITEGQIRGLIKAIIDWVSPGSGSSELNKYYMQLPTSYRAAHRPMVSITELRLVRGMTPEIYNAIEPYISALPTTTQVNVQTAAAPVLAMLNPTMNLETGVAIQQLRQVKPFATTQDFLSLDIVKNHPIPDTKITVVSSYFLIETTVSIEKQHIILYTLLERTAKDKKAAVTIIWQSKGTW